MKHFLTSTQQAVSQRSLLVIFISAGRVLCCKNPEIKDILQLFLKMNHSFVLLEKYQFKYKYLIHVLVSSIASRDVDFALLPNAP